MNKNKIIFLAAIWIVLLLIFIIFILMRMERTTTVSQDSLTIWTVWHSPEQFKSVSEQYALDTGRVLGIEHKDFESYSDYKEALLLELAIDDGPDIFMLNNSERILLSERISGILPEYIAPEDFRKSFLSPFSEELIDTEKVDGKNIDYVLWVPAWFETLGLFYDRRSFVGQDLETWAWVGEAIEDIKDKNSSITPLWIGHWSSVLYSWDIFAQFLINNNTRSLIWMDPSAVKRALWTYKFYSDSDGENNYAAISKELEENAMNNISLFSSWDIKMLVWFPSILAEIKKSGFSKNFLSAEPFPKTSTTDNKLIVNYNFFVINEESDEYDAASRFLAYLSSQQWAETYYDNFTQRLPAHSLITQKLNQKFDPDFNISYKDVLKDQIEFVSFDKWIVREFDEKIPSILNLEDQRDAEKLIFRLSDSINCKQNTYMWDTASNPNCKK